MSKPRGASSRVSGNTYATHDWRFQIVRVGNYRDDRNWRVVDLGDGSEQLTGTYAQAIAWCEARRQASA